MTKQSFAWISCVEALDDDGIFLEDGPELRAAERAELKECGAPDTDEIEFVSILPEDRDEFLVEALVTPAFIEWAKQTDKDGNTNLPYYE